ncbi:MAG: HAD family phosphatase [candidate division Zixibacteria bacterium]|nr:HAD family phosphatase [candidate division Zixibacteria bacterium]
MNTTVIFDMGNVILPFDPVKPCAILGRLARKIPEEVYDLIYDSQLEYDFEKGVIDGARFAEGCRKALGIDLSDERIKNIWSDMFEENFKVSAIVRSLRGNVQLMLLSNTNEWHFEYAQKHFPIINAFEDYILSYRVGALKPEPKIYEEALKKCRFPDRAIFIDDVKINAVAGEAHGIRGIYFNNYIQLEEDLKAYGIDF